MKPPESTNSPPESIHSNIRPPKQPESSHKQSAASIIRQPSVGGLGSKESDCDPSVNTFTMIVSEKPRPKSRSTISPDKIAILQRQTSFLPEQYDQAIRTAHWVNAVNNELSTISMEEPPPRLRPQDSLDSTVQQSSADSQVIIHMAEINHRLSDDTLHSSFHLGTLENILPETSEV